MRLKVCIGVSLALFLGGAVASAQTGRTVTRYSISEALSLPATIPSTQTGQTAPAERVIVTQYSQLPQAPTEPAPSALEYQEDAPAAEPKLGPTRPEEIDFLMDNSFGDFLKDRSIRVFGWLDAGYTYSTSGPGLMSVEPRPNRFGNEFTVNQAYLAIEKQLDPADWSFGYRFDFFGGSDAILLQPLGEFKVDPNDRFGFEFRQVYVSAHLPILTEGGMDVKFGKQNSILGYEPALAPYRPLYSNDYQWFYSTDKQFTGILTNWHVSKQLDFLNGISLGEGTFFTERSESPTFMSQVNYWITEDKITQLTGSVMTGPQQHGFAAHYKTYAEARILHKWSANFTQVVQSINGYEDKAALGDLKIGHAEWWSAMNIFIYHLTSELDVIQRTEWFDDVNGARTLFKTAYEEVTLGFDYHPYPCISVRPEVRGDFADDVRPFDGGKKKSQFTAAVDCLVKF